MKGSYALVLRLDQRREIRVGRLGPLDLPAGYWVYFGSALNSLEGRLRRHLAPDKKLHWHIDYLTTATAAAEVWWAEGSERLECRWTRLALECPGVQAPARKFGSSDCRTCPAHLVYVGSRLALAGVFRRLETAAGPGLPINRRLV